MPVETKRLVLYLSGKWDNRNNDLLRDNDVLVRSPDMVDENLPFDKNWEVLPRVPCDRVNFYCSDYCKFLKKHENDLTSNPIYGLSNNHFGYGVLAVIAQIDSISTIIVENNVSTILIFSAITKNNGIPSIGYTNSESNLGSKDIIGSIVAKYLREQAKNLRITHIVLRGDLLSSAKVRRLTMFLVSIALIIRLSTRVMLITQNLKKSNTAEGLIFVRTKEHARHAVRLFSGNNKMFALVTPQFFYGNLTEVIKILQEGKINVALPSRSAIIRSLLAIILGKNKAIKDHTTQITVKKHKILIGMNELLKDYKAYKIFEFQRQLVKSSIQEFGELRFTVGFETQGPIAWIEGCEPRSAQTETRSIQSVLIANRALPIFPLSNVFYADSFLNCQMLGAVGNLKLGQVKFDGTPFRISKMIQTTKFSKIGYFSSDHEIQESLQLLQRLCCFAEKNSAHIYVRMHPRDNCGAVAKIILQYRTVCHIAKESNVEKLILSLDVCVTRVSSISKESLAYGRPVINVLMTKFDREIHSDYLHRDEMMRGNIVESFGDLEKLLKDPKNVCECASRVQQTLFKGRDIKYFNKNF